MRKINGVVMVAAIVGLIASTVSRTAGLEPAGEPSPAELKIQAARARIERSPERYEGHNDLAMALAKRARETANPDFYVQADKALGESRRIAPGNIEADRIEVWLLLGRHDFASALDRARALNKRVPDDLMTYGIVVDA